MRTKTINPPEMRDTREIERMPGMEAVRKGKAMYSPTSATAQLPIMSRFGSLWSIGVLILSLLCSMGMPGTALGDEEDIGGPPPLRNAGALLTPLESDLGEALSFTFTVTYGAANADSANLARIELAAEFTNLSAGAAPFGWSVSLQGSELTWVADPSYEIPPGGAVDFTFTADAPANVGDGGDYLHTWEAESTTGGAWNGSFNFHVREPNLGDALMTVLDENAPELQRGDFVTYTLTVSNTGDMTATGVEFRAEGLPHWQTNYVPQSTFLNGVHVPDTGGGSSPLRTWMLVNAPGEAAGVIPPGGSVVATLRVQVKDNAKDGSPLSLRFRMRSGTGHSANQLLTGPTVRVPGASMVMNGPAAAALCQDLTYEVVMSGAGEGLFFDTYCEISIPEMLTYQPGTAQVVASAGGPTLTDDPVIVGNLLLFNHDGSSPNPGNDPVWDLPPGETITITFDLKAQSCDFGLQSFVAEGWGRDGANMHYVGIYPSGMLTTEFPEPVLAITQMPAAQEAYVEDLVSWNITVASTGLGDVPEILVTERLEKGLEFDPAGTSPAPTTVNYNPNGSTTLKWDSSVGQLALLPAGATEVITVSARLIDCENYDVHAKAVWGCAVQGPCQEVTADASLDLQLNEPELSAMVSPNPIHVPSCTGAGVPVSVTLENPGGPARGLFFTFAHPGYPLQVMNVSGATHTLGVVDTFRIGDFTGSTTVTFDLVHEDACQTPSGPFILEPWYSDDCDVLFAAHPLTGQIVTQGLENLSVDLNGPIEVPENTTQGYLLNLSYGSGPPPNPVSLVVTYPTPFTYNGDASLPPDTGSAPGSPSSTWTIDPSEFDPAGNLGITFSLTANDGECSTYGSLVADTELDIPCGDATCARTASAELPIANDCPNDDTPYCDITFERYVDGAHTTRTEPCEIIQYENTITFADAPYTLSWQEVTFEADAAEGQRFLGYVDAEGNLISGQMELVIENGGNECLHTVIPERDGDNRVSLNLDYLSVLTTMEHCDPGVKWSTPKGNTVILRYAMTAPHNAGMFFDFGRLIITDPGLMSCAGLIAEPVEIVVRSASMRVAVDLPDMVDACGAGGMANVVVTKHGDPGTYDNVIYFGTDDFEYIDDPNDPDYFLPEFAGLPNVGVPTRVNDIGNGSAGVMWKIGDLPPGFDSGRIDFPVRKRCEDASTAARVVYDDLCGDDDTDNIDENSRQHAVDGLQPILVRRGDVTLTLTPETVLPVGEEVTWTLYAINGGSGGAYNVEFECTQEGDGLSFVEARCFKADGSPVGGNRFRFTPEAGGGASAAAWIRKIPAGETWTIEIDGLVEGCDALRHKIKGHWGCLGETCQAGPQMRTKSDVSYPEAEVVARLISPNEISGCDPTTLLVQVKNASLTRVYRPDLVFTLPSGLEYESRSTLLTIHHAGGITEPTVVDGSGGDADPDQVGNDLIWRLENHLSEPYLAPGDTFQVAFEVVAGAGFSGGALAVGGTFETPCGDEQYIDPDRPQLEWVAPSAEDVIFTADLDPIKVCASASQPSTFDLTWINSGEPIYGPAEVVITLPTGLGFITSAQLPLGLEYPTASGQGVITSDPSYSGTGETGNPMILRWTIPSTLFWEAGEVIHLHFVAYNKANLNCEHFVDGAPLIALLTPRACPDGEPELVIGPHEAPVTMLAGYPELEVEIVDLTPNGPLSAGDELQVILNVANSGDAPLSWAHLELTFPEAFLSYVDAAPSPQTIDPGFLEWRGSEVRLDPGEAATVIATLQVENDAALGEVFTIEADYYDTCCDDRTSVDKHLTIGGGSALEIQLAATGAQLVPGLEVTYELILTNTGFQTLQEIVIDVTPDMPGMTLLDSNYDVTRVSFTGTPAAPQWTISPAALDRPFAGGESELIRFSYDTDQDENELGTPPGSGSATMIARVVSAEDLGGEPVVDSTIFDQDDEVLTVGHLYSAMDLQVVPTAATVRPGDEFTYAVTLTNLSEAGLTDVVIEAPIPQGFTYTHWNGDEQILLLSSSPVLRFSIPTLALDASKLLAINFGVSADPGDLTNPTPFMMTANGIDPAGILVVATEAIASSPVQVPGPGLDVYKLSNTGVAVPGGEVIYTVVVTNTGDQTLYNVEIQDLLPVELTLTDAQLSPGVYWVSSPPPTYRIAELDPGAGRSFNLVCAVDDNPFNLPDEIDNTVTAHGLDQAGDPVMADPFTLTLPVGSGADAVLRLQKVATVPVVVPGEPVSYLLTVTNASAAPIYQVQVVDTPPTQFTFLSATHDAEVVQVSTDPPIFEIATLDAYTSKTIGISFDTDPDYSVYPDSVANYLDATGLDEFENPVVAEQVVAILPVVDRDVSFMLSKVNTEPRLYAGSETTYFVSVTNTGNQDLFDVHIVDLPSRFLDFVSAQTGTRMSQVSTNPIEFLVPHLPVHAEETFAVTFDVQIPPGEHPILVANSVDGYATDEGGNQVDTDEFTNNLRLVYPEMGLKVTKVPTQGEVTPGGTVTYLIDVENLSEAPLTDVTIVDTLPPGLTFSFAHPGPGMIQTGSNPPTFLIGLLPVGGTGTLSLTCDAAHTTNSYNPPVMNVAHASGTGPMQQLVEAEPDTVYLPLRAVEYVPYLLDIEKVATTDRIVPGGTVNYLLTVTNLGREELTNIEITDGPPNGLTLSDAQFDTDVTQTGTNPPAFSLDTLKPDESTMISLIFDITDDPLQLDDPSVNYGYAQALLADTLIVADPDSSVLPVIPEDGVIDIEKVAVESPFPAGGLGHYLITITNNGVVPLTDVEVTDVLVPELTYVDSEPPGTVGPGGVIEWDLNDLVPGESQTIILTVGVDYSLHGQMVYNAASVQAWTPDNEMVTDVDGIYTPCLAEDSSVHIEKLPNETRLVMGGQISYHLLVSNDGGLALVNGTVRDTIPDGLSFVNADFDDQMLDLVATDPVVTLQFLQPLEPTSSEAITLFFNASRDYLDYNLATGDSTVVNAAAVSALDPMEREVGDWDAAPLDLMSPDAAIQVHYTHTTGEVIPGERTTYLIVVENIGDQTLDEVFVLVDDLTAIGLEYEDSNYDPNEFIEDHLTTHHRWRMRNPLPAGGSEQIRVTYRVTNDISVLPPVVASTASAQAVDEEGEPLGDSADEDVPLSPKRGSVSIDNTAAQGAITPGQTVTFILTISAGPQLDLLDLEVDAMSLDHRGLTYYDATWDETVFDKTGSFEWTALDTIHAGAIEQIRVTYLADEDAGNMPLAVTMEADVRAVDIYGRDVADTDEETLSVLLEESNLLIEKIALATAVVPGETVTYLLTATNNGNQALDDLVIRDLLPEQLAPFASYHDSTRITWFQDPDEPEWHLNDELEPGEAITVRFLASSDPDPSAYGETLINVAEALAIDENYEDLYAQARDVLPVHTPDVAVDIAKFSSQNVITPGSTASYSLEIQNVGRTELIETLITEDIPDGFVYQASYFDNGLVTLATTTPAVTWEIGELEPGRKVEIQVVFDVDPDPGTLTNPTVNTATAEATGPGNQVVTDLASVTLPIQDTEAAIYIEKRATTSVARPGELLEYSIHVTNTGDLPLTSVTVTDTLTTGLTHWATRYDENLVDEVSSGGFLQWDLLGEFHPGMRTSIYLTALVHASADSVADPVINTAHATGLTPGEDVVSDQATEILPLAEDAPRVTIQKFTNAAVVRPGEELLYTVQITNTGNRDIIKAFLRDELPLGLTYVSSVFDPNVLSFGGNTIDPLWNVARLPIAATETITIRLRADADYRSIDDPIVNVATIEAWDQFGEHFTDSDFEETPLAVFEPSLNLDVLATTGTIVPGGQVTYLVSLTNTGDEDLFSVAVTDTLPAGLTIHSTDYDPIHVTETRAELPAPITLPDGRQILTWSMQTLTISSIEQMRLTCSVSENSALFDSLVTHTFYASAMNLNEEAVTDSDADQLLLADAGAKINIAKSALRGDVVPGEYISYLLTVRNAGRAKLHDAVVVDDIPDGLTYDQTSFNNTRVRFAGADGDSAVWTISGLEVGAYEQIRVTYLAASTLTGNVATDTLHTTASVRALDGGDQTVTDTDDETLPIHPDRSSIQVVKWADATNGLATQGSEIAYHIQLINTGEQDLTDIVTIDYMPDGLRFLEADQQPDSVVVDQNQTRVYWHRNLMHQVESWEVMVRARIDTMLVDGAVLQNRATATATDERGEQVHAEDVSRVLAGLPNLSIDKIVDRPVAEPSEKLTYTISYRNSGTADAENVVVTDILPAHMTYMPGTATGGAFYEPRFNSITRTVSELEIDQGAIFSYQVLLDPIVESGTRIPNTATVYSDAVSPAESDTAWVLIQDKVAELVKTVDKTVAAVFDTLTYTLTYQNLSDVDYAVVSIRDQVPSEVNYISGSAEPAGVYDPGSRLLTWDLGALDAGHVGSVSFQGAIRSDAIEVGRITNEGEMLADGLTIPSNKVVTLLVETVGVSIVKAVDLALAVPGDTLSYTMTVTNIGPSPLTAITVSDAVPTELTYTYPRPTDAIQDDEPAYDLLTRVLSWQIGVIEPERDVTLTFVAVVNDDVRSGTTVSNTATVLTNETEPVVSNPARTLIQYPDLVISKVPDRSPVVVGEEVTYTISIKNQADGTTDSTWVNDVLPSGFTYVTGSTLVEIGGELVSEEDPVVTEDSEDLPGQGLTWQLGRLGAYARVELSYRALVTGDAGPGYHDNYATACGFTPLGDSLCTDPAIATVEVVVPSLSITKTTSERSVELGDLVLYQIEIQNNTTAGVTDLEIRDHLPIGFQILPGSSVLNGERVDDPVTFADGLAGSHVRGPAGYEKGRNVAIWTLAELAAEGELSLSYIATVGLNASAGVAANIAEAVGLDAGGGLVIAGPTEARVFVLDDELPGRLRGRVIVDCDDDGRPDAAQPRKLRFSAAGTVIDERGDVIAGQDETEMPFYQGVEILVEDGRRQLTDAQGEFFFYPLEYGDHAAYLDPRSLEAGTEILGDDSQFFHVLEGGEARLEFRVCPPAPRKGSLQLSKRVTPDQTVAVKRVLEPEVFLIEGILFDTGRATLKPEAGRILAEAAKRLIEDPSAPARIEGHTDIRPIRNDEFADNYALSNGRAKVVRDALVNQFGLDASRFSTQGYGPDRPVAPNTTARNLSLNRRTEIILLPSVDELTPAALFDPPMVSFAMEVAYEGNFRPGEGAISKAKLFDALPNGLEYLLGTTRINGAPAEDPDFTLSAMTRDGYDVKAGDRLLEWSLGTLRPGDVVSITYDVTIVDVPEMASDAPYVTGRVSGEDLASEVGREIAEVDSLLRDSAYRGRAHLWENRAWLEGVRANGEFLTTDAAGADLRLAFERRVEPIRITVGDVLFDTGKSALRPEAFGILDPAADLIRSRPGCSVRIEGHTDIRPIHTAEFPSNQELSDGRANSVLRYFIDVEGLDPKIFSTRGFGPRRPISDNETAAGRQKNRRVEILIHGSEVRQTNLVSPAEGEYPRAIRHDLR